MQFPSDKCRNRKIVYSDSISRCQDDTFCDGCKELQLWGSPEGNRLSRNFRSVYQRSRRGRQPMGLCVSILRC
jgi:hypothetical protein